MKTQRPVSATIVLHGAFFGTLCAASIAHAESLYVIEQLVVSVNAAADGSGERVGQIKSGDQVELIERQDEQAHVRLGSGQEGWVKASYLSADPPLREQVTLRNQEIEKLRKEKTQLEADLTTAKSAAAAATAAAKAAAKQGNASAAAPPPPAPVPAASPAPPPEASSVSSPTAENTAQSPPLFGDREEASSAPSWLAMFGAVIIALGVGFAVGWRVLDRRIRAKYGGLRIY